MSTLIISPELNKDVVKEKISLLSEAHLRLNEISLYYPNFSLWYQERVSPGLVNGTRKILVRHINGELAGVAIIKKTQDEKKICCLRVFPKFQGTGVGVRLFVDAFQALETEQPLLSVAEEQLPKFEQIFTHFGFSLVQKYRDIYRANKEEFSFNGVLLLPKTIQNSEVKAY